jgi:DNA-binding NarL/FixJ family response regulator
MSRSIDPSIRSNVATGRPRAGWGSARPLARDSHLNRDTVLLAAQHLQTAGRQRRAIIQAGYSVSTALTFEAARDCLAAGHIDAVVLNLPLAGEVMDLLQLVLPPQSGGNVAVVVVGSDDDPSTIASTLARRGIDYLRAPFQPAELVARVAVALCWLHAVRGSRTTVDLHRGASALCGRLTPAETSVAVRAAVGSTNRSIADELFVSVKCLDFHLGNIFRKLGVANRTQLAALFFTF